MARLKKGETPTPLKDRLARYREDLLRSGGRRVIVDLPQSGASALHEIIERDTPPDAVKPMTVKDAITNALVHYARKPGRRRA